MDETTAVAGTVTSEKERMEDRRTVQVMSFASNRTFGRRCAVSPDLFPGRHYQ